MSTPDLLPEPVRRCVDQAVAAEALEGWRPTAGHVQALVALVNGDMTFDAYLAAHLSRYPPRTTREPPRRSGRRGAPYLLPGTTMLRNNFGADTREMLSDLEFVSTAGRIACWHRALADCDVTGDDLDIRAMHRRLFGDVYAWAGDYRIVDLRLGDEAFARRSSLPRRMRRVQATVDRLVAGDAGDHPDALAEQLAQLYADYNYVHPFREGNGRTGTTMLHTVAALRGRRLDLRTLSQAEWYAAARRSMPVRRYESADHRPFLPLIVRALD